MSAASAAVLDAISSPRRREILRLCWDREVSAGEIHRAMPDVSFGAVSLQLKTLSQAGLVAARGEKQFRYYRANRKALGPVAKLLESMWSDALWKLKLEAELEASRRGPRPQATSQPKSDPKRKTKPKIETKRKRAGNS